MKYGKPETCYEDRVLTLAKAEAFNVYLMIIFCTLYRQWCCHQGLFKDSIIHSRYIFSVFLLSLLPPLNTSCCWAVLLFCPFVCSLKQAFWLIVRRVTGSRETWDYSAVACLTAQCHALVSPTETLGAWHHLLYQCLLDVLLPFFAETWLPWFPRAYLHGGRQLLRFILAERLPQQETYNCFHSCRRLKLMSRKHLSTTHVFYLKMEDNFPGIYNTANAPNDI